MERLRQLGRFHHDPRMEMQKRHAWFRESAFDPKPDRSVELQPSVLHEFGDFPTRDDADPEDAVSATFEKFTVPRLQPRHRELLERGADRVFGISVISCWEVAKLVEYGRLKLDRAVGLWIEGALAEPGVSLLHLHPRIVVESTQLPQPFHRDPADQLTGRNGAGRNRPRFSVSY